MSSVAPARVCRYEATDQAAKDRQLSELVGASDGQNQLANYLRIKLVDRLEKFETFRSDAGKQLIANLLKRNSSWFWLENKSAIEFLISEYSNEQVVVKNLLTLLVRCPK